MGLRTSTPFLFGPTTTKLWPLNDDLSTPIPTVQGVPAAITAIAGVGPFDFSGVALISAVEFFVKVEEALDSVVAIDLTAAVSQAAVTAAEMVTAITAAGYTGVTASVVGSRLQIDVDTVGTDHYIQVYGEGAELSLFGQGFGLEAILLDTQESVSQSPTLKESENIETIDTRGLITEVITDFYRKGSSGVLTDTAYDLKAKALLEGGTLSSDEDFYEVPTSESSVKYFAMEIVQPYYSRGTNLESALVGYVIKRIFSCVASPGDEDGARDWQSQIYNYQATEYKDPAGNISGDTTLDKLTKAEYLDLNFESI